jgi:type II restriction enzyme
MPDRGERTAVTAGQNMNGFIDLLVELARANGLADAEMCTTRALVTLPGFFRPTKAWDLVIKRGDRNFVREDEVSWPLLQRLGP